MKKAVSTLFSAFIGSSMALAVVLASPAVTVQAAGYPNEILLGAFWESDENTTDTLYWSLDGVNFYELAEAYTDATPNDASTSLVAGAEQYGANTLHDPGIIYKDGYFWMISGFEQGSGDDQMYIPMLGFSKDLVHWSYPASGSQTNVKVSELPPGKEKWEKAQGHENAWFAVAPELFLDDDGTVWIAVCMGYFALFNPADDSIVGDIMKPYLIKIESIDLSGVNPENNPGKAPVATYSKAVPINLPAYPDMDGNLVEVVNRIDGSFYKEGDYYYFIIKKDGVTNEIWRTKTLSLEAVQKESNWELVNDDAVTGFEGPSLTKFNGTYFLYTDKLKDYPPDDNDGKCGVHVNVASTATTGKFDKYTGWLEANQFKIVAHSLDGGTKECRHGTVITLTDPDAIKIVWDLKNKTIYASTKGTEKTPNFVAKGWYQKESYKGSKYGNIEVCYWYEGNARQGIDFNEKSYRGKEIYDSDTDGWYWLDNNADGRMAVSKDVYQPYTIQGQDNIGKWVRYDKFGKMLKGQVYAPIDGTDEWGFWWFDETTGAMQKGFTEIYEVRDEQVPLTDRYGKELKDENGNPAMVGVWYKVDKNGNRVDKDEDAARKWVYYDEMTGIMQYGYHEIKGSFYLFDPYDGTCIDADWREYPYDDAYGESGTLYWYDNGERAGYKIKEDGEPGEPDLSYRGKEVFVPYMDAWVWCDNIQKGAFAKGKDVYQESYAGIFADREDGTGKWVRYDEWGKMIKGWDWGALDNRGEYYFFEGITGAMAKGEVWIGPDSDGDGVQEVSREASEGAEHWYFDEDTGLGERLD